MDTEALVARFQALQRKREQLNTKKVELSTTFQHHKKEYQETLDKLKKEFNVNSLQEGYALRDKLSAEATAELDRLSQLMAQFDDLLEAPQ